MRGKTCYMCDCEATTREHVPPQSFFGSAYREGILTVPSCPAHNSANSQDVEYVRNIITFNKQINEAGTELAEGKVMRSLQRSRGLAIRTLKDLRKIQVGAETHNTFRVEVPRLHKIIEAIAYALYYHNYGTRAPFAWKIFGGSTQSEESLHGMPDGWQNLRDLLNSINYYEISMPQPKVFQCGVCPWSDTELAYKFVFYEGFVALAFTASPDET